MLLWWLLEEERRLTVLPAASVAVPFPPVPHLCPGVPRCRQLDAIIENHIVEICIYTLLRSGSE